MKIMYFFATGFGIGKISIMMPVVGTIASLLAIPMWWGLVYFFSYQTYFIFLILGIIFGIYLCGKVTKFIGIHDHQSIVWDEFVGMWITLIVVPLYSWMWIVVAFLLFRVFDVIKPWPISWCDRVIKGGFGIIIDDILAGFISIHIILFFMQIFP
ncbi:phosphatidylglycerophosphatase A [Candidatus Blochmanniella vafra str. BVAF]|uniref:Phosphatidylglycerophosphatase A n=1 Tax=Blochmanniella vafra (strain BVAF) TaxID=859654 RepID=E8Q620_BLOVB|nr:phosphatidylglycerophosphatase A [Candidatus Blochmannia vafer]ADV33636.1 phosphatidylglycerophosphatase A [Candidatus Blochmannia vafer str. BVAF]